MTRPIHVLACGLSLWCVSCIVEVEDEADDAAASAANDEMALTAGQVITKVTVDFSTHVRRADESDNFPMTWHPNGRQYTVWGDGWGFEQIGSGAKRGLGVSELIGGASSFSANDVFEGDAQGGIKPWNGKSYGLLALGSTLHMWVSPGSGANGYLEARMAKSTNNGQSWTKATWAWTKSQGIILPSILQAGRGYSEGDDYVYSYASRLEDDSGLVMQSPGKVDLMRVPRAQIMNKSAYRFFNGLTASGGAKWTTTVGQRKPVFTAPAVGWAPPSVIYNVALDRYLMVIDDKEKASSGGAGHGLAFYEAAEPWGPWSEVPSTATFDANVFFAAFAPKWTSSDGKTMWLVYTGADTASDEWDSFNLVKVKLTAP
jgi:hypothetical protein